MIEKIKQRLKDLEDEYKQINIIRNENVKEKKELREQLKNIKGEKE